MRRFRRFAALLILTSSTAFALGRIDCSSLDSQILKRPVHYCVQLPFTYDAKDPATQRRRYPVLYFLHGLGDNEQTLFKTGGWTLIEDLRQQHKIGEFLIVAPEGRASFYINSADGKDPYNDFFLREFIPYIEKKYRVALGRANRAIGGISMGGYGALRFAFAHPELFSSVSAQSAALILDSPQQVNLAARSGSPVVRALSQVFGNPIDVAHWQANNPFLLARKNRAGLQKLAIYFNCGQNDDYGFEKGAAALDKQLTSEGLKHEYHPYPGDHSLNYFLTHLGETMEFHSRGFAHAQ
ncbi:MAG TPA: alpha/beta hydrolase family protein [Terriglobales bacterium]|jgi:S-formylglutathione hydrolase FrmB|nr:alpha/beta hydrolase family protein [Terriglobales bacterium]